MSVLTYEYITFEAAAPKDLEEKERVLRRLENIAKKHGARFRRERVKWDYYDLFKREGESAFAAPWEMAYPIDEEHVRAAWNYFNKPDNRAFYTPHERRIIIERIARAAIKHNIKIRYNPKDQLHRTLPESLRRKMESSLTIDLKHKYFASLPRGWVN